MHVLIVEDNWLLAADAQAIVERQGLTVVGVAPNAATALALAAQQPPDLALVDANLLDGFTGPAIAQHLAYRYGTRIVFVSGHAHQVARRRVAMAALTKPVSPDRLVATITSVSQLPAPDRRRPRYSTR